MNLRKNQKGFTIVELLIVVVVIAILAAISIVAYTGITNRANRSAAMEAANSVKSVATAYNGANSAYPTLKSQFVSGGADPIAKLPSDITFVATMASAPTNPKTVIVMPRVVSGSTVGFTITYWDYTVPGTATMTVGDTTSGANGTALPDNT